MKKMKKYEFITIDGIYGRATFMVTLSGDAKSCIDFSSKEIIEYSCTENGFSGNGNSAEDMISKYFITTYTKDKNNNYIFESEIYTNDLFVIGINDQQYFNMALLAREDSKANKLKNIVSNVTVDSKTDIEKITNELIRNLNKYCNR